MIPGKYNIVLPQGTTLSQVFTYSVDGTIVNLTGYTARMQVREKHTSTTTILDLTTANGGIEINGPLGLITIKVSATDSALLPAKCFVYDLEIVSGSSIVYRIVEGTFTVTPEVTR
jgi:hypothetical protein